MSPVAPGFGSMKPRRFRKMLERQLGYREVRRAGSHVTLESEGRPTLTFAFHNGVEIGPAMVRQILVRDVGLTLDQAKEVFRRG